MKRTIIFLSMVLMFLGASLANPPPVIDIADTQTELINYLPGDQPVIHCDAIEMVKVPFVEIEVSEQLYTCIPEVVHIGYDLSQTNMDYTYASANIWQSNTGKIYALNQSFNRQPARNLQTYQDYGVPFVERGCL